MNDITVGMENLPNIFIQKIMIHPRTSGSRIKVQVGIYDHSTEMSWRGRISDMKVKIFFSSDPQQIDQLNNGILSLFDIDSSAVGTFVISAQSFIQSESQGNYDIYLGNFELGFPENPTNLNVYAACFIDGFGFGIPMFDKFYGPLSAERIFVAGQINNRSNYFYYPDTNEEYGGPTHQHLDSGFMEGSQHSEVPHKKLILVPEENYKIQKFSMKVGYQDVGPYVGNNPLQGTAQTPGPAYQTQNVEPPDGVPQPAVPNSDQGYSR